MSIEEKKLKNILEAGLMAMAKPMSVDQLMKLFDDEERPSASKVKAALTLLQQDCENRGVELKEVSSGYRYQARQEYATWLSRLWEEKPAKYSRAYLETLALIAYRQPVTRAEIEEVRGVGVSSNIIRTMVEREWIRVVGHRDVPGRPSLYATTRQFLDYFNMKSLDELPSLAEIKDLDDLNPELEFNQPGGGAGEIELTTLSELSPEDSEIDIQSTIDEALEKSADLTLNRTDVLDDSGIFQNQSIDDEEGDYEVTEAELIENNAPEKESKLVEMVDDTLPADVNEQQD